MRKDNEFLHELSLVGLRWLLIIEDSITNYLNQSMWLYEIIFNETKTKMKVFLLLLLLLFLIWFDFFFHFNADGDAGAKRRI